MIPSLDEIQTAYNAIFLAPAGPLNLQIHGIRPSMEVNVYAPVTEADIQAQLRTKMSAAIGLDGIHLRDNRCIPARRLTLLLNGMLLTGSTPPSF